MIACVLRLRFVLCSRGCAFLFIVLCDLPICALCLRFVLMGSGLFFTFNAASFNAACFFACVLCFALYLLCFVHCVRALCFVLAVMLFCVCALRLFVLVPCTSVCALCSKRELVIYIIY